MPASLDELIDSLPPTDAERQLLAKDANAKLPVPAAASKFTGPEPAAAAKLCEQFLAGGKEMIVALLGRIRDPASADYVNYKAEYLAHLLVVHAGAPDRAAQRGLLAGVVAEQVGNASLSAYVRLFLIRELQWIGSAPHLASLAALLGTEPYTQPAVSAMVAIREGAGEALRSFFPKAEGPVRLAVLHGLAALQEVEAAAIFRAALTDENRDVRITAAWGCVQAADAAAAGALLRAADAARDWERIKLTASCVELADRLQANGKKEQAAGIYRHLLETRQAPSEKYLRELAEIRLVTA